MFEASESNIKLINEVLCNDKSKVQIKSNDQKIEEIILSSNRDRSEVTLDKNQIQFVTFNNREKSTQSLLSLKTESYLNRDRAVFRRAKTELSEGKLKLDYLISHHSENATYDDYTDYEDNDHICTIIDFILDKDLSYGRDEKVFLSLCLEVHENIFIQGLYGVTPKQSLKLYNRESLNLVNKIYRIYRELIDKEKYNNRELLYLIKDLLESKALLTDEMHKYATVVEQVLPLTNKAYLKKKS